MLVGMNHGDDVKLEAGPSSSRKRRISQAYKPGITKTPKMVSPNFRHGAIMKMKLHNFLTFNDVEIHPSPQLNVIVGPNGTGKSSLVCAMCLGLGGKPNLLGRAKNLKDFVKHGAAKEAFVELTLYHDSGNHPLIRREIKKETSTSKWFLNGRDKQENEIIEFIKQFNIQLDNKCQFLPQDKVVEFAKLDSYQLLEETEKAIGKEDMHNLHVQLKGMKENKVKIQSALEDQKKELEKEIRANALLERDVRRLQTRQECLLQIKHLKWKKYWLDYEQARVAFDASKTKRREAEQSKRDLHRRYEPLIENLKQKEAIVKDFERKEKKCREEVDNAEKKVTEKHRELVDLNDDQKDKVSQFNSKLEEEDERKEKVARLQNEIQSFRSDLEKLPSNDIVQSEISTFNQTLKNIQQEVSRIQDQQQPLVDEKSQYEHKITEADQRLREIDNVYSQRLAKLNEKDYDTHRAIQWLNENQSRFQRTIHRPVVVLLQIKAMQYASQIEDFFMGRDAFSFICESEDDYEMFAREVRDRMKLRINVVVAPNRDLSSYRPVVPLHQLNSYGFKHMMLDLVEAPSAVLAYFCEKHFLHNIPIADNTQQVDRFVSACPGIQRFYVKDNMYIAKRSNYSRKTITRSNRIRSCYFFLSTVNEVEKATLLGDITSSKADIARIDQQLSRLDDTERDLRRKDKDARESKNKLNEMRNEKRRLERNIQQREIQMNQLRGNPVDIEHERELYRRGLETIFEKKSNCLTKITENTKVYKNALIKQTLAQLDSIEADHRKKHYDREKESITSKLKEADEKVDNAKLEEIRSKDSAKQKLEVARRETKFNSPDEISRSRYKDVFHGLPNDVNTIEENIHELRTQAELCGSASSQNSNGEDVMTVYEERKKKIERLQEKIQQNDERLKEHNNKTNTLKEKWLVPLEQMMKEVNEKFSSFFSMMGCVGEVELSKHDHDFSQFGVQIRVKFRSEEQLQILNSHRQSGGERSVSTMMYLMALQDITSCPFRVVDEINQGMDSSNERRVFNLIVESVKQNDTSQYFMLTPKLLQGLNYSECVTVHAVHNGPELAPF